MTSIEIVPPVTRDTATVTIPPRGEHKATIVFLHGLGDSGEGVQGFFEPQWWHQGNMPQLLKHPHIKWIFPSALKRTVTGNPGHIMPAWFDVEGLQEGLNEDCEGVDRSAKRIAAILEEERRAAPLVKLILGGISQGGALALHLTVRKFAGTFLDGTDASSVPMDGTICLCGWLIAENKKASMGSTKEARKYRILYCHGKEDIKVAFDWGKNSAEALQSLGFSSLEFIAYDGLGHTTSPKELEDVKKWIERRYERPCFRWVWPSLKKSVEELN